MREPGSRTEGLAKRNNSLYAGRCQSIAHFGLSLRRMDSYGLRSDIGITHRLTQRLNRHHIDYLAIGIEVDRLFRAYHDAPAVKLAPHAIVRLESCQYFDLFAQIARYLRCYFRTGLSLNAELLLQQGAVAVDIVDFSFDVMDSAGDARPPGYRGSYQ